MSIQKIESDTTPQPIIRMILPQYIKWHHELMVNLKNFQLNGSGLAKVFAASGYHVPEKTAHGLLVVPIEYASLQRGILRVLPQENQTYTLRVAVLLAGLLDMQEAIPPILNALQEDRCDDMEQILALKALIMLGYDPKKLLKLLKDYVSKSQEEVLKVLLIRSLVQAGTATAAKHAFKLIKSLDKDQRIRTLPHLQKLHGHHIDTTELLDFIVEDSTEYYADVKVEWARTIGTREVLERFLDGDNTHLLFTLLYRCLAAPHDWELIYPLLIERKDDWLAIDDSRETKVILAFMAVLGRFGHDLSAYRTSGNWVLRCGAWLAATTSDEVFDFDQLLGSEDDGEVIYAIELARTLHEKSAVSPLQEPYIFYKYRGAGYDLDSITRGLAAGFGRRDALRRIQLDHLLATERDPSRLYEHVGEDEELFITNFRQTSSEWIDFPGKMFHGISLHAFNSMIMGIIHPHREFGFYLAEMFLKNRNFGKSGTLQLLMALRDDVPSSATRRAKELLHVQDSDHINLTRKEFDILYPYVFLGDHEYASLIVSSATAVLRADPQIAPHILRLVNLDDAVNERVMDLMSDLREEPLAQDLARVARGELPATVSASALALYGDSDAVLMAKFQEIRAGRLSETRALSELYQLLAVDDEDFFALIMDEFARHVSREDIRSLIETNMHRGWTIRRACARFLQYHPTKDFLALAFALLEDKDSDVGRAAADACSVILDTCLPDLPLVRFVDAERDDDEKLAAGIKSFKSRIKNPAAFKNHLGKSFILTPFDGSAAASQKSTLPGAIPRQDMLDLILHMAIDFVDAGENRLVVHITEQETGEVINWLLEQGLCTFFSAQKA